MSPAFPWSFAEGGLWGVWSMAVSGCLANMCLLHLSSLTVVSAVRLVVIVDVDVADPDMTWNIVDSIIWSHVEGNIAILCCKSMIKSITYSRATVPHSTNSSMLTPQPNKAASQP